MKIMKNNIFRKVMVISAILGLLLGGDAWGQTREIPKTVVKGSVVSSHDQPMKGIVVKSFNTSQSVVTDTQGNFEFGVTAGETDRLTVSLEGYRVATVEVVPVHHNC